MTRLTDFSIDKQHNCRPNTATATLYLHIPFCRELCSFCTFNRVQLHDDLGEAYFDQLSNELDGYAQMGFEFRTVYIGGGTPTILPKEMDEILTHLHSLWKIEEISVETTPADLTDEVIAILVRGGVKRLSIGVQSFQDDILTSLNRRDKYGSGEKIIECISDVSGRFETINIDLIFGLDGQAHSHIDQDLATAKSLSIDQITYYPLMKPEARIKPYRAWLVYAINERNLYFHIRNTLQPEFFPSSAWCFSRQNSMIDEYIISSSSYAGAGGGAFSYLDDKMVANVFSVSNYIQLLESSRLPILFQREFSESEKLRYQMLLNLFGGHPSIKKIISTSSFAMLPLTMFIILLLILSGTIKKHDGKYRVSKKGAYRALILMKHFFQGISRLREACRTIEKPTGLVDQYSKGE